MTTPIFLADREGSTLSSPMDKDGTLVHFDLENFDWIIITSVFESLSLSLLLVDHDRISSMQFSSFNFWLRTLVWSYSMYS